MLPRDAKLVDYAVLLALVTGVVVLALVFLGPLTSQVFSHPRPTPSGDAEPRTGTPFNAETAEATLWQLLQNTRTSNGLPPLTRNDTLVSIARWRSQDLVERNYFSPTILGTSDQVYHWYDLEGLKYAVGGENIGWNSGYSDADSPIAIHNGWMNSSGYRANILRPNFTEAGVGVYGADNVSFLGSTRSPRVYTLLFLEPEPSPGPSD